MISKIDKEEYRVDIKTEKKGGLKRGKKAPSQPAFASFLFWVLGHKIIIIHYYGILYLECDGETSQLAALIGMNSELKEY